MWCSHSIKHKDKGVRNAERSTSLTQDYLSVHLRVQYSCVVTAVTEATKWKEKSKEKIQTTQLQATQGKPETNHQKSKSVTFPGIQSGHIIWAYLLSWMAKSIPFIKNSTNFSNSSQNRTKEKLMKFQYGFYKSVYYFPTSICSHLINFIFRLIATQTYCHRNRIIKNWLHYLLLCFSDFKF